MEYRITFSGQGEFLIISPRILNTLIEKIHNSGKLELSIQVGDIMSESYREYILKLSTVIVRIHISVFLTYQRIR